MGRDWVWVAPMVSLALVTVGQATNADGDLSSGLLPRLIAAAAVGFALLGLRLIAVHGPDVTRLVLIGGSWTTLAFLWMAGFFVAVEVGALLGIDENEAGFMAVLPAISMTFGLLSIAPAVVSSAFGLGGSAAVPRLGVFAISWVMVGPSARPGRLAVIRGARG